jgi:hypothetical protein
VFVLYRIYSVSTVSTLMLIYEVQYNILRRKFMIDYLCVLFVGGDVERRLLRIIR